MLRICSDSTVKINEVVMSKVTRRVEIVGKAVGLEGLKRQLNEVDKAQDGVAVSAQRMTKVYGSSETRLNRIQRSLDANFRAVEAKARVQRELDAALHKGAITQERYSELLALSAQKYQVSTAAANNNSAALVRNAASAKLAAFQQRNLVFQLNDVFVSLVSGMNPMMVAAQQGSQIATIYGPNEGGIGRAFKETGLLITKTLTRFPLVTAAVATMGIGFAGLTYEINKSSKESVGFGDVLKATILVLRDRIYSLLKPAIDAISPWFATAWNAVRAGLKSSVNFVIKGWVGAATFIKTAWGNIPSAVGDVTYRAVNNTLKGITFLLNEAVERMNRFIEFLDAKLPEKLRIGQIGQFEFSGIDNPFAGAANDPLAAARKAISGDPAGDLFADIRSKAIALSKEGQKAGKSLRNAGNQVRDAWGQAKSVVGGFLKELTGAVRAGDNFWGSFLNATMNALNRISDKLIDMAVDNLFSKAFGGFGIGGQLGSIFTALGGGGWNPMMGVMPSFSGGGYTGNAPRSGGVDGRGGFLAVLHPRETVVDHTRPAGRVHPNDNAATGGHIHVSVSSSVDKEGNIRTYVERVSGVVAGQLIKMSTPQIVDSAVGATKSSLGSGGMDDAMSNRYNQTAQAIVR